MSARQPLHTVYGGAHLFKADTARRLGERALSALEEHGAPAEFGAAFGLDVDAALARTIRDRVAAKLGGSRSRISASTSRTGTAIGPMPKRMVTPRRRPPKWRADIAKACCHRASASGSSRSAASRGRAIRTLDRFVTTLASEAGQMPTNFVVTLPKITDAEQVSALVDRLEGLERKLDLPAGTLRLELMIETTESVLGPRGECAIPGLVEAARRRCRGAHFGTYDYTASCQITAAHQHMTHPACDFAKHMMQVALASTGVWLSTAPPTCCRSVTRRRCAPRGACMGRTCASRSSAASIRAGTFIQHSFPASTQPCTFFLEGLDAASTRLRNFVDKAAQATVVGEVFDDAATGQGLLNYFLRALSSGAITEAEGVERSGLTIEELRSRPFAAILRGKN